MDCGQVWNVYFGSLASIHQTAKSTQRSLTISLSCQHGGSGSASGSKYWCTCVLFVYVHMPMWVGVYMSVCACILHWHKSSYFLSCEWARSGSSAVFIPLYAKIIAQLVCCCHRSTGKCMHVFVCVRLWRVSLHHMSATHTHSGYRRSVEMQAPVWSGNNSGLGETAWIRCTHIRTQRCIRKHAPLQTQRLELWASYSSLISEFWILLWKCVALLSRTYALPLPHDPFCGFFKLCAYAASECLTMCLYEYVCMWFQTACVCKNKTCMSAT